ncbi:MAG: general secretion pathway protein GspB [Candidatus Omnitrophica bacterium]|nr:general secretion pathway protein GspB [Candidatus Omnitrophota bacterium]
MELGKIEWERLNKILWGIFLCLLGWFLLDVFLSLGRAKKEEILISPEERAEIAEIEEIKAVTDFSKYSRELKRRQLFKGTPPQERSVSSSTTSQETLRTSPSDFQLLGIAGGSNPQVIILNKKTNQTYFLYEGESQDNLQVEEISGNKVKLNYGGERFELFL